MGWGGQAGACKSKCYFIKLEVCLLYEYVC